MLQLFPFSSLSWWKIVCSFPRSSNLYQTSPCLLWEQLGVCRFLWIPILPGLLLAGESQRCCAVGAVAAGRRCVDGISITENLLSQRNRSRARPTAPSWWFGRNTKTCVYWHQAQHALLWFRTEQGLTIAKAGTAAAQSEVGGLGGWWQLLAPLCQHQTWESWNWAAWFGFRRMKSLSRNHFFLYKIYSEASERLYLNLSLAWRSTFQLVQCWHEPYYKPCKQCCTVIWFDLFEWEIPGIC